MLVTASVVFMDSMVCFGILDQFSSVVYCSEKSHGAI